MAHETFENIKKHMLSQPYSHILQQEFSDWDERVSRLAWGLYVLQFRPFDNLIINTKEENMECKCGNKGCTTELKIYEDAGRIDLRIIHKEKGEEKRASISLDPNGVVQLVRDLKNSLANTAG